MSYLSGVVMPKSWVLDPVSMPMPTQVTRSLGLITTGSPLFRGYDVGFPNRVRLMGFHVSGWASVTATSRKDDSVQSTLKNGLSNLSKAFVCCLCPKSFRGIVSIILGLELSEERDSAELLLVPGWAFAAGVGLSAKKEDGIVGQFWLSIAGIVRFGLVFTAGFPIPVR